MGAGCSAHLKSRSQITIVASGDVEKHRNFLKRDIFEKENDVLILICLRRYGQRGALCHWGMLGLYIQSVHYIRGMIQVKGNGCTDDVTDSEGPCAVGLLHALHIRRTQPPR